MNARILDLEEAREERETQTRRAWSAGPTEVYAFSWKDDEGDWIPSWHRTKADAEHHARACVRDGSAVSKIRKLTESP
jgi:hypothetical protein